MIDSTSKYLDKNRVRKIIAKMIVNGGINLYFRAHALKRMTERGFATMDVLNVLSSPTMRVSNPEPHAEGPTYRCSTQLYEVVIAVTFDENGIIVVTVKDLTKRQK